MTPEQKAREAIDQRLIQAGWILQDMRQLNPMAGPGVAVREFPTSTGPIDYALFVEGKPVGVVEATATDAVTILLLFRSQFRCSAEFHGACRNRLTYQSDKIYM